MVHIFFQLNITSQDSNENAHIVLEICKEDDTFVDNTHTLLPTQTTTENLASTSTVIDEFEPTLTILNNVIDTYQTNEQLTVREALLSNKELLSNATFVTNTVPHSENQENQVPNINSEPVIATRSHKRFCSSTDTFNLNDLLHNTCIGISVIKDYEKNHILSRKSRNTLTTLIIQHFLDKSM